MSQVLRMGLWPVANQASLSPNAVFRLIPGFGAPDRGAVRGCGEGQMMLIYVAVCVVQG